MTLKEAEELELLRDLYGLVRNKLVCGEIPAGGKVEALVRRIDELLQTEADKS